MGDPGNVEIRLHFNKELESQLVTICKSCEVQTGTGTGTGTGVGSTVSAVDDKRPHFILVRCICKEASSVNAITEKFASTSQVLSVALSAFEIEVLPDCRLRLFIRPAPSRELLDLHNKLCLQIQDRGCEILKDFRKGYWQPRCRISEGFEPYLLMTISHKLLDKISVPLAGSVVELGLCEAEIDSEQSNSTSYRIQRVFPIQFSPSSLIPVLGKLSHTLHSEPFDLACEIIKQWSDSDRYSLCVRLLSPAVRNFQTRLLDILNLEGIKGISSEDFKCIAGKQYPCLTMATFEFWDYKKVKEEIVEKVQLCGNLQNLMIRRLWRGTDSKIHYTDFMSFPLQEIRAA